mgnify:FL=1
MRIAKLPTLYWQSSKSGIMIWNIQVNENPDGYGVIIVNRGFQDGKIQRSEQVIESGKNIGKKNETSPFEQAVSEARSKWNLKKIKNGYSEDIPIKEESVSQSADGQPLTSTFNTENATPMLAKDFKKDSHHLKWDEGVVCQPKLDGVRALCGIKDGKFFLKSRGNKYYNNLDHIKNAFVQLHQSKKLSDALLFDCELYSDKLKFEDITGICRKQKALSAQEKEKELKVKAHIFDILDLSNLDMIFSDRYKLLCSLINGQNEDYPLLVVDTKSGFSVEALDELHEEAKSKGYEGIMLRNVNSKYKQGPTRSSDLIKMKSMMDDEFQIVNFKEGLGQEAGTVIWVCKTKNGSEFAVRPMGTREQRKEMFENGNDFLGKLLTVRFQEWSKENIPRFPVGVEIRDYE